MSLLQSTELTKCMCCAVVSESSPITGGQMVSKVRIMTEEEVGGTLVLTVHVYAPRLLGYSIQ